MYEENLTNTVELIIENKITKNINFEEIIKELAFIKSRKVKI